MPQGRHSAPRHAAPKGPATPKGGTGTGGARRASGGARKGPAPVAGRRVAERHSVLTVVRAGSLGTLTAVAPLAVLSVACVVGLGANPGQPASAKDGVSPQPIVPTGSTFHTAAHRAKHRATTPDQLQAADSVVTSGSVADSGVVVAPQGGQVPTAQPTSQPTAAPTSSPSLAPVPVPTALPTTSTPVSTATATPEPLTEAEATAQCLADGVSALDVVGLAACVTDLLNP